MMTYHRVVVGEKIVLDCLASGYPPPTYSWYKDGGRLSPAHDRFMVIMVFMVIMLIGRRLMTGSIFFCPFLKICQFQLKNPGSISRQMVPW